LMCFKIIVIDQLCKKSPACIEEIRNVPVMRIATSLRASFQQIATSASQLVVLPAIVRATASVASRHSD
jgi:hypothetical protein